MLTRRASALVRFGRRPGALLGGLALSGLLALGDRLAVLADQLGLGLDLLFDRLVGGVMVAITVSVSSSSVTPFGAVRTSSVSVAFISSPETS